MLWDFGYNLKYKYIGKTFSIQPLIKNKNYNNNENDSVIWIYLLHETFILRDKDFD